MQPTETPQTMVPSTMRGGPPQLFPSGMPHPRDSHPTGQQDIADCPPTRVVVASIKPLDSLADSVVSGLGLNMTLLLTKETNVCLQ